MVKTETATFSPGKVIHNKWIIIELIGKGAMGEVYRAHQTNLKRDVAIKIISEEVMSEIEDDQEELDIAFGRFQREVQTMAQVRHTNILTIYDYGEITEVEGNEKSRIGYIVIEFIPGDSLRFTLSEDGLDDSPELYAKWIKDYFMPILDGVEVLHQNKIIHRDLKPENIFLDGKIPKIADFGLARSQQMKAVTISLEMLGTLAYMSPEQCSDFKYADYPTDIYALGKILYEAVNGTLTAKSVPFTSVSIENPQTDFFKQMSQIIVKATAEKPENRYQTIREFRGDLQQVLSKFDNSINVTQGQEKGNSLIHSGRAVTDRQIKMFAIGIVIVILLVIGVDSYDLFYKPSPSTGLNEEIYDANHGVIAKKHIISAGDTLTDTILGKDGSTLILTGNYEDTTETDPLFYMDTQKITNFLFFEFLHNAKGKLTVKNGIVRHDGKLVMYLGDGSTTEDSIIFVQNRFHLKNQAEAGQPVLRVTYHGAQMYAEHFGRELLTDQEWLFAYQYHFQKLKNKNPSEADTARPNTTTESKGKGANNALDKMGQKIKEWVRIIKPVVEHSETVAESNTLDSGVISAPGISKDEQVLQRFPWEGFADVGFRTKIPIVKK